MITIVRDIRTGKAVLGRLYFNGTVVCYTLENATKAIPCGMYIVQNSKSPKFKRELPLVWNEKVPTNRGIRLHVGNSVSDSSGCILVGMDRHGTAPNTSPLLLESAKAETMVTMLCRSISKLVIVEEWA